MIKLTNTTEQTVAAGAALTFNSVLANTNCSTCHRKGTGSVKLNRSGAYMVSFHANVTGATAATPVQLALALGGDVMPETTMIFTPETANTVGQMSICLPVFNSCCDYDRVTVVNTGTTDIVISANPMLAISKMCG